MVDGVRLGRFLIQKLKHIIKFYENCPDIAIFVQGFSTQLTSYIQGLCCPKPQQWLKTASLVQEKTKDLRIPYSTEKNVNVAGSKEAISNQVPGLPDQISRKYLLLKLEVGFSNEIPESSVNYSKHKEMTLGNAAKMSRKPNLAQLIQFNLVKKSHYYRSYYIPFKTN